jgi:hypothetical protein
MLLTYLMLFVALCLSAVAAFYSIVGLTAIFAAAVVPIVIMGSILEAAKLVVTVWLHEYWRSIKWTMKAYLVPAVFTLMVITSMGIFGFLSKAHLDQTVPTGDVAAQVALIDEKINNERDTINNARTLLDQLDKAVTDISNAPDREVNGRTISSAERALQVRRQQARDRENLTRTIEAAQTRIVRLQEEKAPFAKDLRKIEAEVGPIKYIAALIYGDNPDANLLEKAVRWVIIILVAVFDPLAIMMLLAATESYKWEREARAQTKPLTPAKEEQQDGNDDDNDAGTSTSVAGPDHGNDAVLQPVSEVVSRATEIPKEQWGEQDLREPEIRSGETVYVNMPDIVTPREPEIQYQVLEDVIDPDYYDDADHINEMDPEKAAKRAWKTANPNDTIHRHEALLEAGRIDRLPWQEDLRARADDEIYNNVDFGIVFPANPVKGDAYIRVDYLPSRLFKWNGDKWIEVDKDTTDSFTYNDNYIDHLITKISSGEYDPELLNDNEREQIEQRLRNDDQPGGINV